MTDLFKEYQDLIWGTGPFAADDAGRQAPSIPNNGPPQDQNGSFFDRSTLPPADVGILGPLTAPTATNAAQDQSAALLDPLAFAPPPDLSVFAPPTITGTSDGHSFDVPVGTNFHNQYRAGQYIGAEPLIKQYDDIKNAVGYRGTFDYQRADGSSIPTIAMPAITGLVF